MSREYFESISKETYLAYPWNCVLYYIQFTQEELLSIREWLEIRGVIKYQKSVTKAFLRQHFFKEIDDCLEVDWTDVDRYVAT
jgi:hypothetical protein